MLSLAEQRLTIVGLGLMGGSLAMGLRGRVANITGIDINEESLRHAKELGIIDSIGLELNQVIADTTLLILAMPVRQILATLDSLMGLSNVQLGVIDLGSTKQEICDLMSRLPSGFEAVGGHPICGRERSGLEAAERGMYRGEQFVLCRTARTTESIEKLAVELVNVIEAKPIWLQPSEHDSLLAASSHLPYLMAALLMKATGRISEFDSRVWQLSASGLKDTTRLAGSDPQMMLDIVKTNRLMIIERLQQVESDLNDLIETIESEDDSDLVEWLAQVNLYRQKYAESKGI